MTKRAPSSSTIADEIELYFRTGEADMMGDAWPGDIMAVDAASGAVVAAGGEALQRGSASENSLRKSVQATGVGVAIISVVHASVQLGGDRS